MVGDNFTAMLTDNGDGNMFVMFSNSETDVFATIPLIAEWPAIAGTYKGSDGQLTYNGDFEISYDFTIVDNGDSTAVINGYFQMPNGMKVIFNDITVEYY